MLYPAELWVHILAFRDGLEPSLPVPKTGVLPVALSENLLSNYIGAFFSPCIKRLIE